MPNKIKASLERGKALENKWNENLIKFVNDCINIEINIKDINEINKNLNKYNLNNNINIKFDPKEEYLSSFLDAIKSFGKIYFKAFKFKKCPANINDKRKYIVTGEKENILTKTGSNGWMGTICENELEKSKEHRWKIKLLKITNNNIMVGVAPADFDINSSRYNTCGWYLYCTDLTLYSGPPYNYGGKATNLSKVKDEIIIVMDMNKRTLKFIINNEDKGESYTNIPIDKPICPAVLLYYQNDSIEITDC